MAQRLPFPFRSGVSRVTVISRVMFFPSNIVISVVFTELFFLNQPDGLDL